MRCSPWVVRRLDGMSLVVCHWCEIAEVAGEDDVVFENGRWFHYSPCLGEYRDARHDEAMDALAKEAE